ncbi:S8 family peptidase [Microbispora catharanthi]|uniref:S8 family serine peptidase n=1 Tax=Microbispora catharanthi TaxID=1712871 RepID=A0A5N6AYE4_9ACTN|nr:S8 family serine peptidase [Microbispora catharanthi]KAB8173155.1 S8 family serine peptidase [Microbispora catharanthi]
MRRSSLAVVVTTAALLGLPAVSAAAQTGPSSPSSPSAPSGPSAASGAAAEGDHTVTLVTGDTVKAHLENHDLRVLSVEPGEGRTGITFAVTDRGDQVSVVPSDAAPLIRANRLDPQLFEVGTLIADGYDDARSQTIPVLTTYPKSTTSQNAERADAALGSAAKRRRAFPRLGVSAFAVGKKSAPDGWRGLTGGSAAPSTLRGGVTKLWLDGKVSAGLDQSVPHIGAPTAWASGYDGTGVKVAVLDTGYDTDHPDLQGKVVASADFTGNANGVEDGNSHGTHVASTVAGSGAASGGLYKGVAPGASLVVGKVLGDDSWGTSSAIIAGMEWAVGEEGAKIVSMSIQSDPVYTDHPVAAAINTLTSQYDALFVVCSGNYGPGTSTISSIGVAQSALTVGAVDLTDTVAGFSSRGPVGTQGLKPDMTGPGVDITAAVPGGGYGTMSGCSMATPHVAGTAALVKQRHPAWGAQRLKDALMGTAAAAAGSTPYTYGTGRVDAARAVSQQVTANPPSAALSVTAAQPTATQTVTYTNDSATPVTLNLAVSATDSTGSASAPSGLFTLSGNQVTVPANGTAQVTVTLHQVNSTTSVYGGVLTATATGGASLRTALGASIEVPSTTTTVRVHYNPGAGNRIVLRGDAPLSWTAGQDCVSKAADLWECGVNVPVGQQFFYKPLVNDSLWSTGSNYYGVGGQTYDIYPTF